MRFVSMFAFALLAVALVGAEAGAADRANRNRNGGVVPPRGRVFIPQRRVFLPPRQVFLPQRQFYVAPQQQIAYDVGGAAGCGGSAAALDYDVGGPAFLPGRSYGQRQFVPVRQRAFVGRGIVGRGVGGVLPAIARFLFGF